MLERTRFEGTLSGHGVCIPVGFTAAIDDLGELQLELAAMSRTSSTTRFGCVKTSRGSFSIGSALSAPIAAGSTMTSNGASPNASRCASGSIGKPKPARRQRTGLEPRRAPAVILRGMSQQSSGPGTYFYLDHDELCAMFTLRSLRRWICLSWRVNRAFSTSRRSRKDACIGRHASGSWRPNTWPARRVR